MTRQHFRDSDKSAHNNYRGEDKVQCWMEVLDGSAGWKCWLEVLDGSAGWKCWMAVLDGWMEVLAGWQCRMEVLDGSAVLDGNNDYSNVERSNRHNWVETVMCFVRFDKMNLSTPHCS